MNCPLCETKATYETIFQVKHAPITHITKKGDQSNIPKSHFGRLNVVRCSYCSHIYNKNFNSKKLSRMYEGEIITNTPVSAKMVSGLESTAQYILNHSSIASPTIMDVGAGSGALSLVLSRYAKHVHMIEPSTAFDPELHSVSNITIYRKRFPVPSITQEFDIIVVRQVLEHIPDPLVFLLNIINSLSKLGIIYLEVPSLDYIAEHGSIFDFHYPHIHYFHKGILKSIFESLDLYLIDFVELKNGHDYGFILGRRQSNHYTNTFKPKPLGQCESPKHLARLPELSKFNYEKIRKRLSAISNRPYALYGATAYSQSFLGMYPDSVERLEVLFDDTELCNDVVAYYRGGFIPVSKLSIASLSAVDVVIISAYLHDDHIYRKLRTVGFTGEVYTLRSTWLKSMGYMSLLC